MRTGHDSTIECPVCRSATRLPDGMASSLPRDVTSSGTADSNNDEAYGKPVNGLATGSLNLLSEDDGKTEGASLCTLHARKLSGGAAAELRERVREKIRQLSEDRLPLAQRSSTAVQLVFSELSRASGKARQDIESARKRAVDAIDELVADNLLEVGNIERTRRKALGRQLDDLKLLAKGMESAVAFGQKLLEQDAQSEGVRELLSSVCERADELLSTEICAEPVAHARLAFERVAENEARGSIDCTLGRVRAYKASAVDSLVRDATATSCREGSAASFVVVARDKDGALLTTGGDVVLAKCVDFPEGMPGSKLPVLVDDNGDGTYAVKFTPRARGDYELNVWINGAGLRQPLSVHCWDSVEFDPLECQRGNAVSPDRLTVMHPATMCSSVLGYPGMQSGIHAWRVQISSTGNGLDVLLGVAEKPGLTEKAENYDSCYAFIGYSRRCLRNARGERRKSATLSVWREGDVMQLILNCDRRALSIVNLRTNEEDRIDNLPAAELFPYFYLHRAGASLTLIC